MYVCMYVCMHVGRYVWTCTYVCIRFVEKLPFLMKEHWLWLVNIKPVYQNDGIVSMFWCWSCAGTSYMCDTTTTTHNQLETFPLLRSTHCGDVSFITNIQRLNMQNTDMNNKMRATCLTSYKCSELHKKIVPWYFENQLNHM